MDQDHIDTVGFNLNKNVADSENLRRLKKKKEEEQPFQKVTGYLNKKRSESEIKPELETVAASNSLPIVQQTNQD